MNADRDKLAAGMVEQRARLHAALRAGMPRAGWKVGINVPEVLRSLGLERPGIGWIDGHRVVPSGGVVHAPEGARLHVEPELAIRVARAVASDETSSSARSAIESVAPALEIVDYAQPADGLDAVVAHSMFHAGVVLGEPRALAGAIDAACRRPVLEVGGVRGRDARADLVPDDLGALIAFVAALLAAFDEQLAAGDLVLSGSFLDRAMRVRPGEEARANFGPLGDVSVRFNAAPPTRMDAGTPRGGCAESE